MEGFVSEIRAVAEGIFLGGNWALIGMVVIAALIGALVMRNIAQIICVSVLAMVALGAMLVVHGGATSETPTSTDVYIAQLSAGWDSLSAMPSATMLIYLLIFAVVIFVLFLGKSIFFRG